MGPGQCWRHLSHVERGMLSSLLTLQTVTGRLWHARATDRGPGSETEVLATAQAARTHRLVSG